MAQYGIPNVMDRLVALEKQVRQLQVSARTGFVDVAQSTVAVGSAVYSSLAGEWSSFSDDAGPFVTITTGLTALVLFSAETTVGRVAPFAFRDAMIGVRVNEVQGSKRARIRVDTTLGPEFAGGTISGFELFTNLELGENTFELMGRHNNSAGGTTKPVFEQRSLCVIPFDV